MSKQDYYEILAIRRNADESDIKKAFRALAMKYHPDHNPGNAEAEQRFKEINEAYDVLKDDQKRAAYDRFGHAAFECGRSKTDKTNAQQQNGQIFESVISSFDRESNREPKPPAGNFKLNGAISARAYYALLVEGFSRVTRDSADRFFRNGGYGRVGNQNVNFPALNVQQAALAMSYWDSRVAGTIQTLIPLMRRDADRVRPQLIAVVDYLRGIERERESLSPSDPQWIAKTKISKLANYIVRIEKRIKLLDKPDILREPKDIQTWSTAIWEAEHAVVYYAKLFPRPNMTKDVVERFADPKHAARYHKRHLHRFQMD